MEPLNWTAVIVGTVVAFLAGWAIYSPRFFGKGWAEGSGVELGSASKMPVAAMISQLVALFVLALVVGMTAQTNALWTAILAILAAGLFGFSGSTFTGKSMYARLVDLGYVIVAGVIMIICQGIF